MDTVQQGKRLITKMTPFSPLRKSRSSVSTQVTSSSEHTASGNITGLRQSPLLELGINTNCLNRAQKQQVAADYIKHMCEAMATANF